MPTMPEQSMTQRRMKMSKSRGNVVTIEEATHRVYYLRPGFEFRNLDGDVMDYHAVGAWFEDGVGYRMCSTLRNQPIFLHRVDDPVPVMLATMTTVQHTGEHDFWVGMLGRYE